mgnify:CR=1 FL=1
MISVLFVCHGNICRSPISEFVMKDMVTKRGIKAKFYIASAATSTEEIWNGIGNPVYPPAKRELAKHGISCEGKRAVQITKADYGKYDYILGMEERNIRNILRIVGKDPEGKVKLLLDYSDNPRDIADPWYTGNFEITFNEKNNTYKENISVGDKAVELASGTFVMDGNKLTLTSDGGDVQNLVKQGKYLIAKDYLYEGEIPDGDTFDATCTFKNSNNVVYFITFKADGTYVQDDNGDVSEGTYTRDGDWIKRESSSGTSVGIDYLIYSGRITNSYYIKK